ATRGGGAPDSAQQRDLGPPSCPSHDPLAMQKVEGSSPFIRFTKPPETGGFLLLEGRRAERLPAVLPASREGHSRAYAGRVTPEMHLTFDDGPHETFTPAVLDVLARHGAQATFFQEGRHVERHPELTRRVNDEGHVVGNHAWSHADLATVSSERVEAELASTSSRIQGVTGARPRHFRPPYGSPFVERPDAPRCQKIRVQAAALGMATIIWDITTNDWQKPGRDAIALSVLDAADVLAGKSGMVVLMHDGDCADEIENIGALDLILSGLSARGFTFSGLPDRA
ncbi:MAG: polysaccharide deacetylase, partial [Thermoleophilia bacterium]|nr:polysaccharide deacetylase [Thermoleophilia bacterium]